MSPRLVKKDRAVKKISESGSVLHIFDFEKDDAALLSALKNGHPSAKRALFERYADHVQRVLIRIMGIDAAIPELISETFLQAFSGVSSVRDPASLKAWLSMIAVFTARGLIRKRKKRRIMWLFEPKKLQDARSYETDDDGRETLKVLYEVLDDFPVDERIAFTLRFMEGMVLREVAEACNVSMATVKRRIARAEKRFVPLAKQHPLLSEWLHRGERWRGK
jgi:RNA polymerase sigma-70 factor (ECF subfamily)